MTRQEMEMVVAMEECGELVRAISKVLRHGMTDKNYTNLVEEIGDVQTMINLLVSTHEITWGEIEDRVAVKMLKLNKFSYFCNYYICVLVY